MRLVLCVECKKQLFSSFNIGREIKVQIGFFLPHPVCKHSRQAATQTGETKNNENVTALFSEPCYSTTTEYMRVVATGVRDMEGSNQ